MAIHPQAIVEPGARLHASVEVGPWALIEGDTELGPGCVVESGARVCRGTRMGAHNHIHSGACIGGPPQDLSFPPGRPSALHIGDHNHFRESVTVHRSTDPEHPTRIGDHNYFMAYSHVAHDCHLGDYNILANTATLAGHVELEHHVFLSGQVAVHQFARIGAYAMVSGLSGVSLDVPPYVTVDGHRARIVGLNGVGLRRAGFPPPVRNAIKEAYRLLSRPGLRREEALARLEAEAEYEEVRHIAAFYRASRRGVCGHR